MFARPAYRWAEVPRPVQRLRHWWERLGAWLAGVHGNHPALFRAVLILMIALLVAVLAHTLWVAIVTMGRGVREDERSRAKSIVPRDAGWYRRKADAAAAAGRYGEAMQYAFVALALRLDADGFVRYQASKTPQEYAGEARLDASGRARLGGLVQRLYAIVFGAVPCGADDYQRWRSESDGEWHAPAA